MCFLPFRGGGLQASALGVPLSIHFHPCVQGILGMQQHHCRPSAQGSRAGRGDASRLGPSTCSQGQPHGPLEPPPAGLPTPGAPGPPLSILAKQPGGPFFNIHLSRSLSSLNPRWLPLALSLSSVLGQGRRRPRWPGPIQFFSITCYCSSLPESSL